MLMVNSMPKIRQILSDWGYELVESGCFDFVVVVIHTKRSYYWFNKKKLLQKKNKYHNDCGQEKASEYCLKNREVLKEEGSSKYRILSEIKREAKK